MTLMKKIARPFMNTHLLVMRIKPLEIRYPPENAVFLRNTTLSPHSSSDPKDRRNKEMPPPVKSFEDIPGPKGIYSLPVIGIALHMKPFGKSTPQTFPFLMTEMANRYGPIFKIQTTEPTIILSDPKDFATMVRNEGKFPIKPNHDIFEIYAKRTGSSSICHHTGEDWLKLRAHMQKVMLKPSLVIRYLPMMNQVADDFIQMLAKGYLKNNDAEKTFMAFAAEAAGVFCFNKRLGFLSMNQSQEIKNFQNAIRDAFDIFYKTLIGSSNAYRYYRSKDYMTFEAAHLLLSKKVAEYVKEASNHIQEIQKMGSDVDENNLLFSALKIAAEKETAVIMESAFLGAIESSTSAIQIVLYALAKNPEKQKILRQEIRDVLGEYDINCNRAVTKDDIENMPYLKACVKEVYRNTPIAPFGMVRFMPGDVTLSGYKIPAGVKIMTLDMKACKNAALFEHPEKYIPERWLRRQYNDSSGIPDSEKRNLDSARKWAVIPFGRGARSCPGRRIFEQELYLIVSKLLHKFKIELEPESQNVEFEYRLFRKPTRPLKFSFIAVE